MSSIFQVGDRAITVEEIVPLLRQYQLLPQLLRELVIDQAIANIECTDEEIAAFHPQLNEAQDLEAQPSNDTAIRLLKIQKFKQAQWQHKLETYFLERKAQLDQVIYSLIRTQDVGVADELYFRLQEGEQSFAELASSYSQGAEARTGGLIGPVEIGCYHPGFAQILSTHEPGQLLQPLQLEDWIVIIRIEAQIPAQFDEAMQQRLLDELFENWLQQQIITL